MHEMSIALSILDIIKQEAEKASSIKVNEIVLDIGSLSGIEIESLKFALEVSFTEPLVKGCEIIVNKIEAKTKCKDCQTEFSCENLFSPCPECNSFSHDLLCGKEVQLKSIVVD